MAAFFFVKQRQFPGLERDHVALDMKIETWQASSGGQGLYEDGAFEEERRLERWNTRKAPLPPFDFARGAEVFVLEGHFRNAAGRHAQGRCLRLPRGSVLQTLAADDAVVYVKDGAWALSARATMLRSIVGFHEDAEGHWVAEFECGHAQHVWHTPPLSECPWVLTEEGRRRRLGTQPHCSCSDEGGC